MVAPEPTPSAPDGTRDAPVDPVRRPSSLDGAVSVPPGAHTARSHSPSLTSAETAAQSTPSSFASKQSGPRSAWSDDAPARAPPATKGHLTFFQRYWTKPIDEDPDKAHLPANRRFAFMSVGFLVTAVVLLAGIFAAVAAAIAVTVDRHSHRRPSHHLASATQESPVRLAIDNSFADPALWYSHGTYYAFATNNAVSILQQPRNFTESDFGLANVQIATSRDLITWDLLNAGHDPLPVTGRWATQGMTRAHTSRSDVWAPSIMQRSTDNRFVLYYSANRASRTDSHVNAVVPTRHHTPAHCVGAAVSNGTDPAGPYEPLDDVLACPIDQGGAIDPDGFRDVDGTLYVVYKVDGNNLGHGGVCGNTKKPIRPTPIKLQKMLADGVTPDGEPRTILDRTAADGPLVEAPALIRSPDGIYFLFFSSGCTRNPSYNVKYATSRTIDGPYVRARYNLLQTGDWGLLAPGSVDVHDDGRGGFDMVFHGRVNITDVGRVRAMYTAKLQFDGHDVNIVHDSAIGT